jgi:molecular chaperone Hsp33
MNESKSIRYICKEHHLRIYATISKDLLEQLISIHHTTLHATIALGRTLNAAILLASSSLKPNSNDTLSIKIQCSGPLQEIMVQVDGKGNVRGLVSNPDVDAMIQTQTLDIAKALGAGIITVTRDLGLKEPYTGVSPLLYGDIANDIAHYLTQSEQIPSAIILTVNYNNDGTLARSAGILIQTYPDTPEFVIQQIEQYLQSGFSLDRELQTTTDCKAIIEKIVKSNIEPLGCTPLQFNCRCNKEMLTQILVSIDNNELTEMIEKDHGAQITCAFCKKQYDFTEDDLKKILLTKEKKSPNTSYQ